MTNVLLADISSIAHPIYHLTADDPNPNAMSIAILERIRGLAHGQPNVAIACDSKRSVRKEADPTYKANRPKEDRAALYHQLDIALDALRAEGFPIWSVDGYEADDVIASATALALQHADVTVQIVSADKDLLALVGPRVTMKSLKDGSVIDIAGVQSKFGVRPDQIPDYLCLVGDASDNIRGANKIGPVTAVRLLAAHGNLEGLHAAWVAGPEGFTPAVYESLKEFWGRADDVLNLITLRDNLSVPFEEIAVERKLPAFDAPAVDGFVFDADPTGQPVQAADPYAAEKAVVAVQAEEEERLLRSHAAAEEANSRRGTVPAPARRVKPLPVAVPIVEPPAPVVEAAKVTLSGADPMTPPDVSGPPVSPPVTVKPTETRKTPTMEPQATALVPQVIDVEYTRQLEPRTITEAQAVAKWALDSRLFGSYGSQQAILMMVMAGREMGMSTMHSLRAFDIIEGKPTLKADAIRALILRSGMADYFRIVERTAKVCTFATRRKGDPEVTLSYTIEEAQAAGLVKSGSGWTKNPADMLVARASAKLGRLVYPDVMHGLYAPEEMS